jgi:predicted RNA-binding Zn ribbon-like protein
MVRRESELIGGRLCLDFVNTVSWRGRDEPVDNLGSYADLLRFSVRTGASSRADVAKLRRVAVERPGDAAAALVRARAVREAIYRLIVSWRRGRSPSASDLTLVNGAAPAREELVWDSGRFGWENSTKRPLESLLWPIVWSTAELVTADEKNRVSSCGSAACGWLFYDESRGHRRRWCSMQGCGNRAKARRHYERKVQGG